ncbi:hypothetical protein DV515_00018235 [Chloebia gouldiae]|uniref:G-protein coupled receptors family 1 profile domain-containing protein n=1 Tax=Chloebia gouldiae TaxID=44316 RepID=A0A3L8Q853_CHLGU|nr:hypothetical protein DV515_00018235 [Chloebia gouldiae]
MVSLWSLAVVAFERFLVICKPLGNFTFRGSHALLGCAITWIFGLVASMPPLFGWSRSGEGVWGSWGVWGSRGGLGVSGGLGVLEVSWGPQGLGFQ